MSLRLFHSVIAARGNSNQSVSYGYNDLKPVHHNASYCLRMVDKYSSIVLITNAVNGFQAQVMPNPFESRLQLQVYTAKAVLEQVKLTNMLGHTVYTNHVMTHTGNNNIQLSSLGHLSNGVYLLQLLHKNEVVFRQQVQKVR